MRFLIVAVCISLASAIPSEYKAVRIENLESKELGSQENLVLALMNILPDTADYMEKVPDDVFSDPLKSQIAMADSINFARGALRSIALLRGKEVPDEVIHRLNAIEVLLPYLNDFINRMSRRKPFGIDLEEIFSSSEK